MMFGLTGIVQDGNIIDRAGVLPLGDGSGGDVGSAKGDGEGSSGRSSHYGRVLKVVWI